MKGNMIVNDKKVNYDLLDNIKLNGSEKENLKGIKELKKKYFEIWYEKDNASGMNYEEKMEIFDKVLKKEMEDDEWIPYKFEYPFDFCFNNRCNIHGFIDRIDINKNGDFRVVDYKTSKKIFDEKKLPTSQQFSIYAMAILKDFGKLPIEYKYKFILLDKEQYALTKGWEQRIVKKINKSLDNIEKCSNENKWIPKPTPLCYWCNYCENNPNAHSYKYECDYYSLWKPDDKIFSVKNKYDENSDSKNKSNNHKLIF